MDPKAALGLAVTVIVVLIGALETRQTLQNARQENRLDRQADYIANMAADMTVLTAESAVLRGRFDQMDRSQQYLIDQLVRHLKGHEPRLPVESGAPSETW